MKRKSLLFMSVALSLLMLTACGSHSQVRYNSSNYIINTFKTDSHTVSVMYEDNFFETTDDDYYNADTDYEQTEPSGNIEIVEHFGGELKLENDDTTTDYEIVDNDIIYKGNTYYNLATIVESIDLPCNKNTFINFIIKTVNKESTIVLKLTTDEYIGTDISPFDLCIGNDTYERLRRNYGTDAVWCITINGTQTIYGNAQYMFITDAENDIVIDMSTYDSTPSVSVDNTEDN